MKNRPQEEQPKRDEVLFKLPADLENRSEEFQKWIEKTIDEITDVYNALEPDDAYALVHTSVIQIHRPVGTVNSSSLSAAGNGRADLGENV